MFFILAVTEELLLNLIFSTCPMQCVVSPFVSGAKSTAYIRSYVGALSSATLSASLAGFLQAPSVKTQKHTNLEALNCHRSNIYILCFPLITSSFLFVFPRRPDRFLTDLSETNFFTLQYKNLISLKCCFSRAGFFLLNFYNILIQTDEKAQR